MLCSIKTRIYDFCATLKYKRLKVKIVKLIQFPKTLTITLTIFFYN